MCEISSLPRALEVYNMALSFVMKAEKKEKKRV